MNGLKLDEKFIIAKNYLIPRLCNEIGFTSEEILFSDEIIRYIILNYTDEEGVRTLKKCIQYIISKINIFRCIPYCIK